MANPQKENGFTAIANEIMDALAKYRIPGEQRQVLDVILRKTYGFSKKEDMISNSQFARATGLKKPSICRAINSLIEKNIVIKKANKNIPSYQFNKDYNKWKVLAKKLTVSNFVNLALANLSPTKESITKASVCGENTPVIKNANKKPARNSKCKFIPPTLKDVINYFLENGYSQQEAEKAFYYYQDGNWKDSRGNQVLNWKQKMRGVWFKTKEEEPEEPKLKIIRAGDMSIYENE